jgi:mgtE-like transporter
MIYSWKKIVRFGLPLLTITIMIEIMVGQLLHIRQDVLLNQLPIFLISIPVVNSVGGNIGSILGAHLASGLHIGSISLDVKDKKMRENVFTAIIMGVLTYSFLAIIIYYLEVFYGLQMGIDLIMYFMILIATGFLLICVLSVISVFTAFISFKKGLDPDDIVSPVVTTFGDTLGIIFLFVFIGVGVL